LVRLTVGYTAPPVSLVAPAAASSSLTSYALHEHAISTCAKTRTVSTTDDCDEERNGEEADDDGEEEAPK